MIINYDISKILKENYYECISTSNNYDKGDLFESLVLDICIANGLMTWKLSTEKTGYGDKPDLHIKWKELILVECKNQKKKVGIADLGKFYSSLRNRSPSTIGLYVSLSGFSKEAVSFVKYNYDRATVLLDEKDIINIINCIWDFEKLIEYRIFMLQRGKVEVGEYNPNIKIPEELLSLIPQCISFTNKKNYSQLVDSAESLFISDIFIFLSTISIQNLFFYYDSVIELKLKPDKQTILRTLSIFNYIFGFDSKCTFTISQDGYRWNGIGLNSFIENTLLNNNLRYDKLNNDQKMKKFHHHEIACIVQPGKDTILIAGYDPAKPDYNQAKYSFSCRDFSIKIIFKTKFESNRIMKFLSLMNNQQTAEILNYEGFYQVILEKPFLVKPKSFVEDTEISSISHRDDWPEYIGVVFDNPFTENDIRNIIKNNDYKLNDYSEKAFLDIYKLKQLQGIIKHSYPLSDPGQFYIKEIYIFHQAIIESSVNLVEFILYKFDID